MKVKMLLGLLKTPTKICFDMTLNDNVISKNSKKLSVGENKVNYNFRWIYKIHKIKEII